MCAVAGFRRCASQCRGIIPLTEDFADPDIAVCWIGSVAALWAIRQRSRLYRGLFSRQQLFMDDMLRTKDVLSLAGLADPAARA